MAITTSCSAQGGSHYIRDSGPGSPIIIFLHGVLGDSKKTWSNGNAYWPELLKQDDVFSGTSIYVHEYETDLESGLSNLNVDELSIRLKAQLDDAQVMQHGQLIFIAHSMGGLLARQFLLSYQEIADKTKFILFLSTPTTGAAIANVARLVSRDPNLAIIAGLKRYDFLAEKQRAWVNSRLAQKVHSYCGYETKETYYGPFHWLVVDETSATFLCMHGTFAVKADHFEIAKPADMSADQYVELRNIFKGEMLLNKLDLVNRAAEYFEKGDYDQALKDLDDAIRLDPEYVPAFKYRGAVYLKRKEFGRAVDDYRKAIRLEPNNAEHFYNRGAAYSGIGEYDLAISDYTEAIRLNFYNKALALYYRGVARQNNHDREGEADIAAAKAIDQNVGK
jgi:tetratricopeptide (TPR) repeat protein